MQKFSFKNDYSEGCAPEILMAFARINDRQQIGYGLDEYSVAARKHLQRHFNDQAAEIHFVSGGTQANLIVIAAALRPHEAVISAETGHINVNEAGAIEATGHKICAVRKPNSKLTPEDVESVLAAHTNVPHVVVPKMVYISNATELGAIYTQAELEALSVCCKTHNLYFFVDGARMGSALRGRTSDVTLSDIARLTDCCYIGGTKNGALFGEAIALFNDELKSSIGFHIKQRGGLLAKGVALGVQFEELFRANLFFELAERTNRLAFQLADAISEAGYEFLLPPESNQLFPILPLALIKKLEEHFDFYVWQQLTDEAAAIRLVTSWATPEKEIERFVHMLKST